MLMRDGGPVPRMAFPSACRRLVFQMYGKDQGLAHASQHTVLGVSKIRWTPIAYNK